MLEVGAPVVEMQGRNKMNNRKRQIEKYKTKFFIKWRKRLLGDLQKAVNKALYGCE